MRYGNEYQLCYVSNGYAWFTTQELSKQWGDDWNDAPYEHNAGSPYVYEDMIYILGEGRVPNPEPRYEVVSVPFNGRDLQTPDCLCGSNSPFSVEMINKGAIAWLSTATYSNGPFIHIWAGTPYPEFVRLVQSAGGNVYEPLPILEQEQAD